MPKRRIFTSRTKRAFATNTLITDDAASNRIDACTLDSAEVTAPSSSVSWTSIINPSYLRMLMITRIGTFIYALGLWGLNRIDSAFVHRIHDSSGCKTRSLKKICRSSIHRFGRTRIICDVATMRVRCIMVWIVVVWDRTHSTANNSTNNTTNNGTFRAERGTNARTGRCTGTSAGNLTM